MSVILAGGIRRALRTVVGVAPIVGIVSISAIAGAGSAVRAAPSAGVVRVVSSTADGVVLDLDISDYTSKAVAVAGQKFSALAAPGLGLSAEAGRPALPVKGALIGVPPGAHLSVDILADESRRDALAYPPVPAPSPQPPQDPTAALPSEAAVISTLDASVYAGGALYPHEAARIASQGIWRSQRYAAVEFYPLQYDPAAQQVVFHSHLRVRISFSYAGGVSVASRGPSAFESRVNEGPFEHVLQASLLNYDTARAWRTISAPKMVAPADSPSLDLSERWYNIGVDADGIYDVSCAQLAAAGIDASSLDPATLKLFKNGTEMAINVIGPADGHCDSGDYLEFFGQAATTQYTTTNVYWLTYGGGAGKRMAATDGGVGTPLAVYTDAVHLEQDLLYRSYVPMVEGADHWFWNIMGPHISTSTDYTFTASAPASGAYTATLHENIYGFGAAPRAVTSINGHQIDDTTWSGGTGTERSALIPFPQSYLVSGTNTIRVSAPGDYIMVDNFDVSYASDFSADGDVLRFRPPDGGPWQYDIAGFDEPLVEVFDVADPYNVATIANATETVSGTVQFSDPAGGVHDYVVVAPGQRKSPLSITRDAPADLRSAANGADYIIISYGGFISDVQPLANLRAAQGMRVKVVDVQDVYDEFSDGMMDAQAIRDFLAYAYANWQPPAPSFVLLVGDGNYDFKNHLGTGEPNFIPPYLRMVDPWMGETASDNRYVAFDDATGNTLPQMATGRLPADSAADVDAMVSKIVGYEESPPSGDWRTTLTFVADRTYDSSGVMDTAGNFWSLSDLVASNPDYVKAPFQAQRIYYNPCDSSVYPQCALSYPTYATADEARAGIVNAINAGSVVVNYVGHAAPTLWSNDWIFRIDPEVNSLANGGKLPVILSMTCYDGYFQQPGVPSLAEAIVSRPSAGAVADWAASGLGVAAGHDYLDEGFFGAVMQRNVLQIGLDAMAGKANLWANASPADRDLIDTFNLFGDPATRLAVPYTAPTPTPTATVTASGGTPVPTTTPPGGPGVTSTWRYYFPAFFR